MLVAHAFDVTNFRTHAKNFFDHNAVGNSNVFLPLTIYSARIRRALGWTKSLIVLPLFEQPSTLAVDIELPVEVALEECAELFRKFRII